MENFVFYGKSKIHYSLRHSKRKTLGITVNRNGEVQVSVPHGTPDYKIQEVLIKKGAWIMDKLEIVSKLPVPETKRRALSGESYYFLGRQYRLKVFEANYDGVDIYSDRIIMNCSFPEEEELKLNLLRKWYFQQAHRVFTERFQVHKNLFARVSREERDKINQSGLDISSDSVRTPIPVIFEKSQCFPIDESQKLKHDQSINSEEFCLSIKKLRKSWGRYHPREKKITLNVELIVAPMDCVDYVIIHELCHSQILNHGKAFNHLISTKMPNWKHLKEKLEAFSNGLQSLWL